MSVTGGVDLPQRLRRGVKASSCGTNSEVKPTPSPVRPASTSPPRGKQELAPHHTLRARAVRVGHGPAPRLGPDHAQHVKDQQQSLSPAVQGIKVAVAQKQEKLRKPGPPRSLRVSRAQASARRNPRDLKSGGTFGRTGHSGPLRPFRLPLAGAVHGGHVLAIRRGVNPGNGKLALPAAFWTCASRFSGPPSVNCARKRAPA